MEFDLSVIHRIVKVMKKVPTSSRGDAGTQLISIG